tara:strand:- start:42 stop:281 length:240 start_codon:yes stop_codon:yes gene_type:complete
MMMAFHFVGSPPLLVMALLYQIWAGCQEKKRFFCFFLFWRFVPFLTFFTYYLIKTSKNQIKIQIVMISSTYDLGLYFIL